MAKSNAIVKPNLGLYLDRPRIALDPRSLAAGFNFRVKDGKLNNLNLGWERFGDFTLNGPVMLINTFLLRSGVEHLIFATQYDIYRYDAADDAVVFLTPIYATGTVSASGTSVTGSGTSWLTNTQIGDEISFGANNENDPAATWYEITNVGNDTTLTLATSAGTVGAGTAYTIRKKFTGDVVNLWSTAIFVNAGGSSEDEWWATNGTDDIVRWNGTDDQVEIMSGLGFTAKHITVYKNMMIFANLVQSGTNKPQDFINSDVGTPDNVSSGLSEQFKVHGGTDHITGVKVLGDYLAFYSKSNVTIAQFVGGDLVFIFRTAINGQGAKGPRAIADFGNFHEFIGSDSHYIFDGVNVKEVNQHVWREIIRQQDPVRVELSYAHFDDENGDLLWVVPSTVDTGAGSNDAAPSQAYAEHYLEGQLDPQHPTPYSLRRFPFTATGYYSRQEGLTWEEITQRWSELNFRWNDQFFFSSFPLSLAGDADGKIYTLNTSQNADGSALPSFVRFGRRAMVDGRERGLLTRVYPFNTTFNNDLDVTLYMYDHAMASIPAITDTQAFSQNAVEGEHFSAHYRRGRFFELEFGTDGPNQPWEISGYDVDNRNGGLR